MDAINIHTALRDALPPPSRVDVYTSDSPAGAELDIRLFDPGVTVLTSESVIGLEFDAVYLLDLARSLPCETPVDWRRMYMLCARAKDALVLIDEPDHLTATQLAALPNPPILVR